MNPENPGDISERMIARLFEMRFSVMRQLGAGWEDVLQDSILRTLEAVHKGVLIEHPEAYACGILHHAVCAEIQRRRLQRSRHSAISELKWQIADRTIPDPLAGIAREQVRDMALGDLKPKEREILERAYLKEQTEDEIRQDMSLTHTQFRLNKSRAKKAFEARARALTRMHMVPKVEKKAA